MNIDDGSPTRDLVDIEDAQRATAHASYGRELTAAEREALHERLVAAFASKQSVIRVGRDAHGALGGYYWIESRDSHAFVLDIFVAANARRRGVGAALWADLRRRARGLAHAEIRLAVSERNVAALAFFKRIGLTERDREVREGTRWFELHGPTAR